MAETKRRPGRPRGSKSKRPNVELKYNDKNKSAVISVKMERQLEGIPVNRESGRGWVNWGLRNSYPSDLAELYYNSVTHKSCIDFAVTAILGGGVDYDALKENGDKLVPNYQEDWNQVVENSIKDYLIHGCFAWQIVKNNDGRTYSYFHQPMSQVRFGDRNEDGVVESYWICSDWSRTGLHQPIELGSFSFMDEDEIKPGKAYLFVYKDYTPLSDTYPVPHYISALKSIQSEIELQRYDLRSVLNNFSASGILTLNRVDDEDEKEFLIQNITSMFTGSDNANSLIINFKNNDDEEPATFVKIDKDATSTVDLFASTNERVRDKIIAAHKITSKSLIGYDLEGASLGGDSNTMRVAYEIYMKLFGNAVRRKIVNAINNALRLNGIDLEINLVPLFESTNTSTTSSDETSEDTERATSENENKNLDE